MTSAKARGFLLILLIVVASFSTLAGLFLYGPFKIPYIGGPPVLPTNPGYDPSAGNMQTCSTVQGYQAVAGNCNPWVLNAGNCKDPVAGLGLCSLYSIGGTYSAPLGMVGDSHGVVYCGIILGVYGCQTSTTQSGGYWYIQDPSNLPTGCIPNVGSGSCTDSAGNDIKGLVSGSPTLLTGPAPSGDPTCSFQSATTAGTCWQNNWNTLATYYASNPQENPPYCPTPTTVTACLVYSPAGTNLTVTNALSTLTSWCFKTCNPANQTQVRSAIGANYNCGTCISNVLQTTSKQWYLYREITSIQLQYTPPSVQTGPGIYLPVQCYGGSNGCAGCIGITGVCPDNGNLRSIVQNQFVPELTKISKVSSSRIAFGISVNAWIPAFSPNCATGTPGPGQYSGCFWGIVGVWLGGQGVPPTAGCTVASNCALVQQANTQLPLYSCPTGPTDNSCPLSAGEPGTSGWVQSMATLNNQTIQQVLAANAYSQIYSYVDVQNLAASYSYSSDNLCSVGTLSTCIQAPSQLLMNIPLVFDMIGSYTLYQYYYPTIPPIGGGQGGTVSGYVYDANKGLLGYNPIVAACVGLDGQCSSSISQPQSPTGGDGSYSITNVPPGPHTLSATANGYNAQTSTPVNVRSGGNTVVPAFYLLSITPPGQTCLVNPSYNPLPPYNQLFGGICFPTIGLYLAGGAVVFLLATGILAYSPFGGQLLAGLGKGIGSARGRRGK